MPVLVGRTDGHQEGPRRLTVEMNVRGRDVAGFVAEAQAALRDDAEIPSGVLLD